MIIADEVHKLRKHSSKQFNGIFKIPRKFFWALSGTPLERNTEDILTILTLLEPQRFSVIIKNYSKDEIKYELQKYIFRRLKNDVLDQLPNVHEESPIKIELTLEQRKTYDNFKSKLFFKNKNDVLAKLNLMRQVCDFDPETNASSKIENIVDLVEKINMNEEKVIIFSFTIKPLELLNKALKSNNIESKLFIGDLNKEERDKVINDFKSDKSITALLCSSRIASEGLNLTEANNVIFLNRWWNPSANNQARDRVVRIGQEKDVNVYKFSCIDTVEEIVDEIIEKKEKIFDDVIDSLVDYQDDKTLSSFIDEIQLKMF